MPPHPLAQPQRDLITNHKQFMTITLNPTLYALTARQQLSKTCKELNKYLQRHCKSYLWVAELTEKCNIHYHLTLILKPIVYEGQDLSEMYFKDDYKRLKKLFGFYKLDDSIHSHDSSYQYITKDLVKTHYSLNNDNKRRLYAVWEYYNNVEKTITQEIDVTNHLNDNINLDSDEFEDYITATRSVLCGSCIK